VLNKLNSGIQQDIDYSAGYDVCCCNVLAHISCTKNMTINEKKHSEETKTLLAGCSKAESKILPHCRPPSWGHGTAGDGHYLYLQTEFGEDRCTQFRVTVVTDPLTHTHPPTNKQIGPITIHCTATSVQCKNTLVNLLSFNE